MEFIYKAKDLKGQVSEGTLESTDRFAVARELRARNLVPVSVEELSQKKGKKMDFIEKLFGRVSLHEKIIFTRNLSGMLSAGLSLYRALEVLKKQSKNKNLDVVLDGLISTINEGGTLSEGMTKYPATFSTLVVSMVKAGEESGNLSGTLKEIGLNLEKSYNLSRKVKGALIYPSVIVSAILVIGVLMLIFVVPTLTGIFKELEVDLPPTTKFIITISDTAAAYPLLFLLGLLVVLSIPVLLLRMKKLQVFRDKVVLRLPAIGKIVRQVNTARTARTLSSLLISGVEMTRALTITRDVLQNMYYKQTLDEAIAVVQKGETLSSVFKKDEKLYPVMMGEMVAVGEETGALTQMLSDVGTFFEEEVDAKTKNLSTIIEPILMIFIGGAVGFFAISMISPMYSLLGNIG